MELYEIMIANLTYIVGAGIAGSVGVVVALLIPLILERRERKKRRKMWIKHLRYNKFVNECISRFEKIVSSKEGRTILLKVISGFLGGFTPIGLFCLLNDYLGDIRLSMAYSTLINIFPYLLTAYIGQYIVKSGRRREKKLLDNSKLIANCIVGIKWFICLSIYVTAIFAVFIFLVYINSNKTVESNLMAVYIIFEISFVFGIVAIYYSIINRTDLLNYLKPILNLQYLEKFPYIYITTKTAEFAGRIRDVFDEDLIILGDSRVKKVVEWDSITSLELLEE